MKRIAIIVDVSNLYYCVKQKYGGKVSYKALRDFIEPLGHVTKAIAFGAQRKEEATGFIQALQHVGFECRFKSPKEYSCEGSVRRKADWDVAIALELLECAKDVDLIVLGCADGDLAPAVDQVIKSGTQVLIIGAGISGDLRSMTECIEIPPSMLESNHETA